MIDYKLIERVCNLTCTKEDVVRNQNTIKYDIDCPFKKYYNVGIKVKAYYKFISHEWDDKMLSHWARIYYWILSGGFESNLKENLNSLEKFLRDIIIWDFDGLSLFDKAILEYYPQLIYKWIEQDKNMDHVWQTRENWVAVYAIVGLNDNNEQHVVLINTTTKEYMFINSHFIKYKFEDEYFKCVSYKELSALVKELKDNKYTFLLYSEESIIS